MSLEALQAVIAKAVSEIHPWGPIDEGLGTMEEMQDAYAYHEERLQEDARITEILTRYFSGLIAQPAPIANEQSGGAK